MNDHELTARLKEHDEQARAFEERPLQDPVAIEDLQQRERELSEELRQVEAEPDNPERSERVARISADLDTLQEAIAYRNGIEPGAVFL